MRFLVRCALLYKQLKNVNLPYRIKTVQFAGRYYSHEFPRYQTKLVSSHGYPIETHNEILTKDGYYLTIYRIPHGKAGPGSTKRHPVLLMHGLFLGSDSFVASGDNSIGFLLADRGYDVWLGNVRSVQYSRKHVKYDPDKDKEFWNFSVNELAVYDLPSIINYILQKTDHKNLYYLGFSQGTIIFAMMCAELVEFNNKIRLFVGLAPAIHTENNLHPLSPFLKKRLQILERVTTMCNINELGGNKKARLKLDKRFFGFPAFNKMAKYILKNSSGLNESQMDENTIPNMWKSVPRGTSIKQLIHLLQIHKTGRFAKYDYGTEHNLIIYGSKQPPIYPISNITVPSALYYSKSDYFVTPEKVEKLTKQLPSVVDLFMVEDQKFTHNDFLWGKDAPNLVYNRFFRLMDDYR